MSVQVSLHPHLYSINHPIITFFSSWTFHIDSIYVIIFFEIVKALSLLSILIVGFALTYYILRPFTRVLEFKLNILGVLVQDLHHLFLIVLNAMIMMLDELRYDRAYVETLKEQHFPIIDLIILILFAIIMAILLMNLLIDLEISDQMQIQQNARSKHLVIQIFFLNDSRMCYIFSIHRYNFILIQQCYIS